MRWRKKHIVLYLERMEMYLSSGLALNRALELSGEGTTLKQKRAVEDVLKSVESGGLLSKALSKSIGLSQTISGLIEHGESSGDLVGAFGMAKSLMEREDELLKKCTSAMAYPVIIGIFAALLTIGLVKGVMPQIIPMLKSLHVQLPLLTRVVIFISESFLKFGLIGAGSLICISIAAVFVYRKIRRVRSAAHVLVLHTPLIGRLVHSYFLSVFLRSCGSLLQSGLPIGRAYSGTANAISFLPLQGRLTSHSSAVSRGIPIDTVFKGRKVQAYIAPLIHAGEISGTLGLSMCRAGAILDREIEHALKKLTSLIEPVMMVGMGTVVGSIALSIMMPIYDISKVLQH